MTATRTARKASATTTEKESTVNASTAEKATAVKIEKPATAPKLNEKPTARTLAQVVAQFRTPSGGYGSLMITADGEHVTDRYALARVERVPGVAALNLAPGAYYVDSSEIRHQGDGPQALSLIENAAKDATPALVVGVQYRTEGTAKRPTLARRWVFETADGHHTFAEGVHFAKFGMDPLRDEWRTQAPTVHKDGSTSPKPLVCFQDGEPVGIVMPIRVAAGEEFEALTAEDAETVAANDPARLARRAARQAAEAAAEDAAAAVQAAALEAQLEAAAIQRAATTPEVDENPEADPYRACVGCEIRKAVGDYPTATAERCTRCETIRAELNEAADALTVYEYNGIEYSREQYAALTTAEAIERRAFYNAEQPSAEKLSEMLASSNRDEYEGEGYGVYRCDGCDAEVPVCEMFPGGCVVCDYEARDENGHHPSEVAEAKATTAAEVATQRATTAHQDAHSDDAGADHADPITDAAAAYLARLLHPGKKAYAAAIIECERGAADEVPAEIVAAVAGKDWVEDTEKKARRYQLRK